MNISLTKLLTMFKYRLPIKRGKKFHNQYNHYSALVKERDTSDVWRQLAIWRLVDPTDGVIRFTTRGSKQRVAVKQVAQLYIEDCKDGARWTDIANHAYAQKDDYRTGAEVAAWCAVRSATYDARFCAGLYTEDDEEDEFEAFEEKEEEEEEDDGVVDCCFNFAAEAEAEAASFYAYQNYTGTTCSGRIEYQQSAYNFAYRRHYECMVDKLLELINAAPPKETT